jgi:hypothetical protein
MSEQKFDQKFEFETRKSPCPCGQSSDGFQYVKGSRVGGKCHSDKCGQKFTPPTDLNNTTTYTNGSTPHKTIAAKYDYHNERGELVHQTVRYENPKEFKQRRPDPLGGWIWTSAVPFARVDTCCQGRANNLHPRGRKRCEQLDFTRLCSDHECDGRRFA